MKRKKSKCPSKSHATLLASFLILPLTMDSALADGTETLGPPSIPIASGTDIAAGGTGMVSQPGMIDVNVQGSVQQVLAYWECQMLTADPIDDTIVINGASVTGTVVGGPTLFFGTPPSSGAYTSTVRADITALGLVDSGANSLVVEGLNCTRVNDGVGILVISDDGSSTAQIKLTDGNDSAFGNFSAPLDSTVPQTYTYSPATVDRTATLAMFVGSVAESPSIRPNAIDVTIDGVTTTFNNVLSSVDGQQWDTVVLDVTIPAGTSMLTVEIKSVDNLAVGGLPASFTWTTSALLVPPPPAPALACRVTGGLNDIYEGNRYTAGGQAGAPTAAQPQPRGEWTHSQHSGSAGKFTFHGGTSSAPEGTEIDDIRCSDAGGCGSGPGALVLGKQIDFDGIGTFKNIGRDRLTPDFVTAGANVTVEGNGNTDFDGTFHWFEVNIDDTTGQGTGRGDTDPGLCPIIGFGEKGAQPLANCGCADFYRITIYDGVSAADVVKNADGSIDPSQLNRTDVIYEVWGHINGGNVTIHPPTGAN